MPPLHFLQRACRLNSSLLPPRRCQFSTSSVQFSGAVSSPVLASLRVDLKTAMRNKDTARLSVLRSILADITNSSKTSNPITTDLQLLALLKKRRAAGQTALNEFKEAGREDLVEKEQSQIGILDGYTQTLQGDMVSDEEIRATLSEIVDELKQSTPKPVLGEVLKQLLGPGGKFDGKMVEKKQVVSIVQELLGAKK